MNLQSLEFRFLCVHEGKTKLGVAHYSLNVVISWW